MTLIEVLVSTIIGTLIIMTGSGLYLMSQRAWGEGVSQAEELQNVRVIMDRLSRELRQANEIAEISSNKIMFEDGHQTSRLQYIKYFIDGNNDIKRQVITYYQPSNPELLVRYDTPGAKETIEKDEIIAQNITALTFIYDTVNDTIEINLNVKNKPFQTKINPRNSI